MTSVETAATQLENFGEFFGEVRPATVMVEVKRLISPDMLVEIEAQAVVE